VECIIVFYAMSMPGTNNALVLPHVPIDSFHVCILYSDPKMDTAYLSTSLAFDCIVFATTLACTAAKNVTQRTRSWAILRTIRWDGTLYFCVILSGNVVWMALAINARPGLKLMNAQPKKQPPRQTNRTPPSNGRATFNFHARHAITRPAMSSRHLPEALRASTGTCYDTRGLVSSDRLAATTINAHSRVSTGYVVTYCLYAHLNVLYPSCLETYTVLR